MQQLANKNKTNTIKNKKYGKLWYRVGPLAAHPSNSGRPRINTLDLGFDSIRLRIVTN